MEIARLSFIRNMVAATAAYLYDKLYIDWQDSEGKNTKIPVPIYYALSGKEDFVRDVFLDDDRHCEVFRSVGNTQTIPYGSFNLTGISLDSGSLQQGGIMMNRNLEENTEFGKVTSAKSAPAELMPMEFSFDVSIKCDGEIMRFLVTEAVIETLYKNGSFSFSHRGFDKIRANIGFEESFSLVNKDITYGFGDQNQRPSIEFSFLVTTQLPIINRNLEVDRGARLSGSTGREDGITLNLTEDS